MRSGVIGIKRGLGEGRNNVGKRVIRSKSGGEKNKIRR